jgi:hypothetical protein
LWISAHANGEVFMALGALIIVVGYLSALVYLPLQIATSIYVRGFRRWITLLPVPFAAWVTWVTIRAVQAESNLAPICMIFCSPVVVLFLIACISAERSNRRLAAALPH